MRLPDPAGSRVLLFGAGRYDHPDLPDLPAVERNLIDLAALFVDPAYCGIPTEHVVVEAAPALPAIGRRIDEVARSAEDTLIVYYAGHGIPSDRGKLYLSMQISAPDAPQWTAIDFELVRAAMAGSPARNRVLILDCCYSGRAIETMAASTTMVAAETEIHGTYTLASAGPNVPAVAPIGARHTAFTGALLSLARNGIETQAPLLSMDLLFRELVTRQRRGAFPIPTQRGTDTAAHLALFRNRSGWPAVPAVQADPAVPAVAGPDSAFDSPRAALDAALEALRGFEVDLQSRIRGYLLEDRAAFAVSPDADLDDLSRRHRQRIEAVVHDAIDRLAVFRENLRAVQAGDAADRRTEELRSVCETYASWLDQWARQRLVVGAFRTAIRDGAGLRQNLMSYIDSELDHLRTVERMGQ